MLVRTTKDMTASNNKNHKLSAGDCGTVIEYCREGIFRDDDTIVLEVKWGEIVYEHSEVYMKTLVINEH